MYSLCVCVCVCCAKIDGRLKRSSCVCVCVWARAGGGSCVNLGAVRTDGKWGGPQAERDVLSGGGGRILATLGKGEVRWHRG